MAHLITVTIAGGNYSNSEEDISVNLNVDNIIAVNDNPNDDNFSKSVIIMNDRSKIFVKETSGEIKQIIKKNASAGENG
jgi:hypothetical protein